MIFMRVTWSFIFRYLRFNRSWICLSILESVRWAIDRVHFWARGSCVQRAKVGHSDRRTCNLRKPIPRWIFNWKMITKPWMPQRFVSDVYRNLTFSSERSRFFTCWPLGIPFVHLLLLSLWHSWRKILIHQCKVHHHAWFQYNLLNVFIHRHIIKIWRPTTTTTVPNNKFHPRRIIKQFEWVNPSKMIHDVSEMNYWLCFLICES